jgi:Mrp family chromosome partitioning ATPase
MKATRIEQGRFEPTVFGAVRRYRIMVAVIGVMVAVAAAGYAFAQAPVYRANATVTVPQSTLAQGEARDQYFDSQVLLLRSQEVAERAARLANAALNDNLLSWRDFTGEDAALEITPPDNATPGAFGSSIVAVSFTWPSATVAQVGANAALQAFDGVRATAIADQGAADVAAIERAIRDARTKGQVNDLLNQRAQTLVNLQLDLATHPTVASAAKPQVPINGNVKRSGAIGLLAGLVLAAGLAYLRATRHQCLDDRLDPVAIYDAPLLGEIPLAGTKRILPSITAVADPLPMAGDPHSPAAEAFRFTAGSVERIRAARDQQMAIVFISAHTGADRSKVVANVALAVAESGTPVLAVDADTTEGALTDLLLGSTPAEGFEQVVAGRHAVSECIETSSLHADVTVLPAGTVRTRRITGPAYAKAIERMIAEAKDSFDLVLIDSPALLRVSNAVELVHNSDAAIVVLGRGELVHDHVTMVERLDQVKSNVAGYIYRRTSGAPRFVQELRERIAARAARPNGQPSAPPAAEFAFRAAKAARSTTRAPRG